MLEKSFVDYLVLISAGTEWRSLLPLFPDAKLEQSPYGQFFFADLLKYRVAFLHSGWGKVATAGATQYTIDSWNPKLLINLGTCGGIEGKNTLYSLILAEETIIYDIIEGMNSFQKAIDHYSTKANLDWLGINLPPSIKPMKMFSADRDIRPEDVASILKRMGATVGDWESGAFAWVCNRNQKDWLVIRGVTDLISETYGEALGNVSLWRERVASVMQSLLGLLPWFLDRYSQTH